MFTCGTDVKRYVHPMRRVQVEVMNAVVLDHLHVRFTVNSCRVHLFKRTVVLLLKHTVVTEPSFVRIPVLFKLMFAKHGWKSVAYHEFVQVIYRSYDDLEIFGAFEGLHQLPQGIPSFTTRGGSNHQLLVLRRVSQDWLQSRNRILASEQG